MPLTSNFAAGLAVPMPMLPLCSVITELPRSVAVVNLASCPTVPAAAAAVWVSLAALFVSGSTARPLTSRFALPCRLSVFRSRLVDSPATVASSLRTAVSSVPTLASF